MPHTPQLGWEELTFTIIPMVHTATNPTESAVLRGGEAFTSEVPFAGVASFPVLASYALVISSEGSRASSRSLE
jgi:hypothetical protein